MREQQVRCVGWAAFHVTQRTIFNHIVRAGQDAAAVPLGNLA